IADPDADVGARLFAGDSNNPNYIAFVSGLGLLATFADKNVLLRGLGIGWFAYALVGVPVLAVAFLLSGTRTALLGLVICAVSIAFGRLFASRARSGTNEGSRSRIWLLICGWLGIGAIVGAWLWDIVAESLEDFVSRTISAFFIYFDARSNAVDDSAETRA